MTLSKSVSFLKGLNTKIIFYFMVFAFIPLLIFSILGYYLNREMISEINLDNLHNINVHVSAKIDNYLQYKEKILYQSAQICTDINRPEANKTIIQCLSSTFASGNDFEGIRISNNRKQFNHHYLVAKDSTHLKTLPYVEVKVADHFSITGYISLNQFKKLLENETSNITHLILFPKSKLNISQTSYSHFKSSDSLLADYKIENNSKNRFPVKRGENAFSTYSRGPDDSFILISTINADGIYSDLDLFRNKIFLANIVLALILITMAFMYSKHITKPIHQLVEGVHHIREGKLDYQIKVESNDEIQILAEEFELMRLQLQESYQGFEKKIEKRTRELQEAQTQISHQEKMASLGLMAAGIAHEIGNPLTSISSMAQVIKRRLNNQEIIEFINNILKNIDRISHIVRELVDFSRPSSLDASMTNVNEIVNSAVGIVKYDKRSRHMHFNLELDRNLPKTYLVADHLLQVFINILINAVDASENYHNEINVSSKYVNNQIEVKVEDNGCGIETEKLNRIFEPFYTTKEVGKGTGLGLTVSYGIVKKIGGQIKVKSEIGKGSLFEIALPITSEKSQILVDN